MRRVNAKMGSFCPNYSKLTPQKFAIIALTSQFRQVNHIKKHQLGDNDSLANIKIMTSSPIVFKIFPTNKDVATLL